MKHTPELWAAAIMLLLALAFGLILRNAARDATRAATYSGYYQGAITSPDSLRIEIIETRRCPDCWAYRDGTVVSTRWYCEPGAIVDSIGGVVRFVRRKCDTDIFIITDRMTRGTSEDRANLLAAIQQLHSRASEGK